MNANNRRAAEFAQAVRKEFPGLDLYVPAEHDEFVLCAYELGYLDEAMILAVDRQLAADRDILIAYAPDQHISNGMNQEIEEAQLRSIPWVFTYGSMAPIYSLLERFIR
jgi:hypothetical protein